MSLRYPILLVHGAGFRDLKWPLYWGRIPGILKGLGAAVYYGEQDCWGSIETNALALARRIDEVLSQSGAEKLNIIAHSKGGLDARRAISACGCAEKVASLTTICTPHRGSRVLSRLFALPKPLWGIAAFAVNNWIRLVGDHKPDFLALCRDLTAEQAVRFNEETPDSPGVFYQSYACVMRHPFSDLNLSTANLVLRELEGPNDGLVSVDSALWGERQTVLRANGFQGVSHLDAIDFRRAALSKRAGPGVSDICEVYADLLHALEERGL